MVFGRSGQMFPRQRAFHDAIYEEEYGSDHEEECCQGRGFSAIFCWFLSVIVIIGIAASVVLTVFFILKSKNYMTKTEELDLSLEGDNNGINLHFPETTKTELNSIDLPISASSKESSVSIPGIARDKGRDEETDGKKSGEKFTSSATKSTSTRFPPMRRGPHQMFKESSEEEASNFQNLYPNGKYSSDERERITGQRGPPPPPPQDFTTTEDSSSSEEDNPNNLLTSTPKPSGPYVLFTSPPLTTTSTTTYRRNLQTTRFPTGRTSFTTSTEALDSDRNESDEKEDKDGNGDNESANGHSLKPPQIEEDEASPTTIVDSVTPSTKHDDDHEDVTYKAEESQLNKMLLDEIPPHKGEMPKNTDKSKEDFTSTEFNLASPSDPLARIIKNLAPKWGRNRTIETTTITSGTHKYDFTISSREKDKTTGKENDSAESRENVTSTTTTTDSSTNEGKSGFNSVESPNLTRGKQETAPEGESPFLDVLVGSEDHKTLVTKQTEDGIVTSAILPPWYETPSSNVTAPEKNYTTQAEQESEESSEESEKPDEGSSSGSSVFGGILNFFKNLPRNRNENPHQHHHPFNQDYNSKRIVLKRPGGELLAQDSNSNQVVTHNRDNSVELPNINTVLPSNIMTTTITPDSAVVTDDDILPANNAYHYGTPDGSTNIYGYYPDDDKDNDKTVEHHMVQSESISDPNELIKKVDRNPDDPSHSIELQINSDASSEVVIDQGQEGEEEYPYSRYGEVHHASSEIRKQIVEPPSPLATPTKQGGGIRRPVGGDAELHMKGSENRPVFANTHRNIPLQLVRQWSPNNKTRTNTTSTTSTTTSTTAVPKTGVKAKNPNASVNIEVADNSAEKDPVVNSESQHFERKPYRGEEENKSQENYKSVPASHQIPSSGSFEQETATSGSGETIKWSRPDPNSMSHESFEHHVGGEVEALTGSEELKVHPQSGDDNDVLERKPVHKLDETLYPDSGSTEHKKIYQVFPVGYASSTTTERPSTISEPDRLEDDTKSTRFVPPTPVNFHENMYTFSPPSSDAIYQSKDGWRPLVLNTGEDISAPTAPEIHPSNPIPTPTKPPPAWRTRLQGMIRQPIVSPVQAFDLTTAASENHPQLTEDEYEQEEGVNNGEEELQSNEKAEVNISDNPWEEEKSAQNNGNNNEHVQKEQNAQIKFPETPIQSQSQEVEQSLNQNQQQLQQFPPPPFQRIPMQIQQPMHQQQILPHQQQSQPHQHHHRQQFQFPNNPNIDRSKYMMRPAPPPILMRRPMQNMQYLPPRPQLIPQVQHPPPNQFNNNAPPQDFQRPSQNLVNRRRFKTLGARPRANWTEESRKVVTAEGRNG